MGSSDPFNDLFSSDEWNPQDILNVPTPGVFGLNDSQSSFPQYSDTPSTNHHGTPEASTPCPGPPLQLEKLALLQLSEWDRDKIYNEDPPICLSVTIGWKVTLNGKPFAQDTEQGVVLTLASYWESFLLPKVEKFVAKKRNQRKNMTLQDTKVTVSVKPRRPAPDLVKQYDGTDIDWATIEKQLTDWSHLFRIGKTLRVDLSINYSSSEGVSQQPTSGSSKSVDKRSARSATHRMRAELDAQLEAEHQATGQPVIWPQVFKLFECPQFSCNYGRHCWVDTIGKIHRHLNISLLNELVQYRQDGNVLDSHSDVPGPLQEKIRLEDQQRRDRKRKATPVSSQGYPPVNITNVIPNHTELPLPQSSQTKSQSLISSPTAVSALDIPGYRDDAVRDYVEYLQGKVRNQRHREEFQKAGSIVLDELLDLDQVYKEHNVGFFTAREVRLAPATQFIRDIPAFVKHRQVDDH